MADATILSGDIGVNYLANNRQKLMYWIGGTLTSYTMNQVYSAMATLLDETTTIDSGTAFSAETPVEYTTGKIDTGDSEPWFMSFDLMEKITGGALRTSGWTRVQDSNAGIIMVPVVSGGSIVAGDRGFTITSDTDNDEGTLLEFIDTGGAIDYCMIRPLTSGIANSFDDTTPDQGLTCNAHAATQDSAATTGEQVWANLYSIGTIDSNVHLYLYQGVADVDASRTRVYSWNDATQDWYANGHIDLCVALNDITTAAWPTIDDGYISVFARKYGDLYASFEVSNSTTAGGRNPIPLQTSADLDNTTGIGSFTYTTGVGTFAVGDIVEGVSSGARAIVTALNAGPELEYIPIDDPQIPFTVTENIQTAGAAKTGTNIGAPAASGPADSNWFDQTTTPTVAFASTTFDVDDNGTPEDYGITIDCKSNPLTEVYEWLKYATRNGEVTNDLDGINGERYIGGEVYLKTTTMTNVLAEGESVTQQTSLATGVVVSYNPVNEVILLRDTRGSFTTTGLVESDDSTAEFTPDLAAVTFAPKTASPLGTFAGGTFFGARGVLLTNWATSDENKFQLTPIEGGTKERPQAFVIQVTNLDSGPPSGALNDRVSVFRLATVGGIINKTEYNAVGGESPSAATLVVSGGITQDTPGKATGGWLVLVDAPSGSGAEYKIRYDSWDTSTFTLSTVVEFVTTGTNTATQVEYSGGAFETDVKRGDLVYNVTEDLVGYVKTVDSDTVLQLEGAGIAGNTTGDSVIINCVPITVTSDDDVYVPFIDKIAESASESVSVIFVAPVYYRVKVRNTRAAEPIKPYSSDGTVATSTSNQSIPVIRTEDTIIS